MEYIVYFRNTSELSRYIIKRIEQSIKEIGEKLNVDIFLNGHYYIVENLFDGLLSIKRDLTLKRKIGPNYYTSSTSEILEECLRKKDTINGFLRFNTCFINNIETGNVGIILKDGINYSIILDLEVNPTYFFKELVKIDVLKSYNVYDEIIIRKIEKITI
jgi:hypothetical protein